MINKYIGFKLVKASPGIKLSDGSIYPNADYIPDYKRGLKIEEGYEVWYSDGYQSWSPKDVFDKAYMQIGESNTITQENVDNFIKETHSETIGEKTTLVRAVLVNGFEIIETSSCVDKNNYDIELGEDLCMEKIKNKIWELLGFLLQTAKDGIK